MEKYGESVSFHQGESFYPNPYAIKHAMNRVFFIDEKVDEETRTPENGSAWIIVGNSDALNRV